MRPGCCGESIVFSMNGVRTSAPLMISAAGLIGFALTACAVLFYFDPASHGFYPVCLFHEATGLWCPGCGSLRALHQLLHGHIFAAFRFNPLLVLSLPFCIWFAGRHIFRTDPNQSVGAKVSLKWIWIGFAVVLVFSVWRNLPGSPFALTLR
jgi:hypothetical protein